MAYSADLDCIVAGMDEKQTVVADAKAYFLGVALQGFHIPSTGFGEAVESM